MTLNLVLRTAAERYAAKSFELCAHKGLGYPDSLCDGVAEALSNELHQGSRKYCPSLTRLSVYKGPDAAQYRPPELVHACPCPS
jgi:hypothetical protein